jgi:hypothetical protein
MRQSGRNLFVRVLKLYFEDAVGLIKIRAATYYVKAVGAARCVFIGSLILKCALLLMLAGFVIMHIAIFMFLPWSPQSKAVVLFILGGLYFLISLVYVLRICSQEFWMKHSKASKLVEEVTGKK